MYETKLVNPQGDPPVPASHYLAVNILNTLAAADLAQSSTGSASAALPGATDFHALSIDARKATGALLFRLRENVSAVLVHASVRAFVEKQGIDTLTWFKPEAWAG